MLMLASMVWPTRFNLNFIIFWYRFLVPFILIKFIYLFFFTIFSPKFMIFFLFIFRVLMQPYKRNLFACK